MTARTFAQRADRRSAPLNIATCPEGVLVSWVLPVIYVVPSVCMGAAVSTAGPGAARLKALYFEICALVQNAKTSTPPKNDI